MRARAADRRRLRARGEDGLRRAHRGAGRRRPGQADHAGRHAERRRVDRRGPARAARRQPVRRQGRGASMRRTWCRSRRTGSCWAACATTACDGELRQLRHPRSRARAGDHAPATSQKISELSKRVGVLYQPDAAAFVPLLLRHLVQHLGRHLLVQRAERQHAARAEPRTSRSAPSSTRPTSASRRASRSSTRPRRTSATPTPTPPPPACCCRASATPRASRSTSSAA